MGVSCDQRGQLEVNGRALGVSHALFQRGNFTAGSYVCVCNQSPNKIILISECKDTLVCVKLSTYVCVKWVCPQYI